MICWDFFVAVDDFVDGLISWEDYNFDWPSFK
jgi:hypothetical protein